MERHGTPQLGEMMFASRRMFVRIRQILLRGAVVVALAGAGVGIGAGAAHANASTNCSRWVSEAIYAQAQGDEDYLKSEDYFTLGETALADHYADLTIQYWGEASDLFDLVNRNNCQIP
jgi:hypothetical protein